MLYHLRIDWIEFDQNYNCDGSIELAQIKSRSEPGFCETIVPAKIEDVMEVGIGEIKME